MARMTIDGAVRFRSVANPGLRLVTAPLGTARGGGAVPSECRGFVKAEAASLGAVSLFQCLVDLVGDCVGLQRQRHRGEFGVERGTG